MTYVVVFVAIALLLALVWYTLKTSRPNSPRIAAAPTLIHFELRICPDDFHLVCADAQSLTLVDRAHNLTLTESAARAAGLLPDLDKLIASNFVLTASPRSPELAFTEEAMRRESIHIRITYNGQATWQTMVEPNQLPPNLDALLKGVRQLAANFAQQATAQSSHPPTSTDAIAARVTVDLTGAIYFGDALVSLNELSHELNHLPRTGEIWYHREINWQHDAAPEAEATSHAVLERLLTQRLLVRMFGKDPTP